MSRVPTKIKSDRSVCDMHAAYLKIMSTKPIFGQASYPYMKLGRNRAINGLVGMPTIANRQAAAIFAAILFIVHRRNSIFELGQE